MVRRYAHDVEGVLPSRSDRVERDAALASHVREAERRRVRSLVVGGERELTDGTVSVRARGGARLAPLSRDALAEMILGAIDRRER